MERPSKKRRLLPEAPDLLKGISEEYDIPLDELQDFAKTLADSTRKRKKLKTVIDWEVGSEHGVAVILDEDPYDEDVFEEIKEYIWEGLSGARYERGLNATGLRAMESYYSRGYIVDMVTRGAYSTLKAGGVKKELQKLVEGPIV